MAREGEEGEDDIVAARNGWSDERVERLRSWDGSSTHAPSENLSRRVVNLRPCETFLESFLYTT